MDSSVSSKAQLYSVKRRRRRQLKKGAGGGGGEGGSEEGGEGGEDGVKEEEGDVGGGGCLELTCAPQTLASPLVTWTITGTIGWHLHITPCYLCKEKVHAFASSIKSYLQSNLCMNIEKK